MNQLVIRTLSGVVFTALVVGSILWSPYAFFALMVPVTIISILEFFRLAAKDDAQPQRCLPIVISVVLLANSMLAAQGVVSIIAPVLSLMLVFFIFIAELYRNSKTPLYNISISVMPVIYIAVPLSLLMFFESNLLLGFFIIVWSNDVGAYLVGRAIGRRKLFERISPKKSWEGFVGGIIFAVGIALLYNNLGATILPSTDWIVISVITSLAGVAGDLIESMFKRAADVKDSGNIMPGHGGLLDRFDALLLATPMVWIYLNLNIG